MCRHRASAQHTSIFWGQQRGEDSLCRACDCSHGDRGQHSHKTRRSSQATSASARNSRVGRHPYLSTPVHQADPQAKKQPILPDPFGTLRRLLMIAFQFPDCSTESLLVPLLAGTYDGEHELLPQSARHAHGELRYRHSANPVNGSS